MSLGKHSGRWGPCPFPPLNLLLPEIGAKDGLGALGTTERSSDGGPSASAGGGGTGGDIWAKQKLIPLCRETTLAGSSWHPHQESFSTCRRPHPPECPASGPGRTLLVTRNRRGLAVLTSQWRETGLGEPRGTAGEWQGGAGLGCSSHQATFSDKEWWHTEPSEGSQPRTSCQNRGLRLRAGRQLA